MLNASCLLLHGALAMFLFFAPPTAHAESGGEGSPVGRVLDDLLRQVEGSVVQVVAYRPTGPDAGFGGGAGLVRLEPSRSTIWATGVVVDERGHVLTCAEAAQPGDSIQIRMADRRLIGARFLAQDVERGVSLIRADSSEDLVPIRTEDGTGYEPGSWQAVINYESELPHPRVRLATLKVAMSGSSGSISYLRLDMADCVKACGGAVLDGQGRFSGMLVSMRAEREQDADSSPSGFVMSLVECERVLALSSSEIAEVCHTLEEHSRNRIGFLGVRAEIGGPMGASGSAAEPLPTGRLIVINVLPGSPAETAGILPGDHILSIGGKAVADAQEITESIAAFRPGTTIPVGLLRNGVPLVLHPRLGDRSALEWLAREEDQNSARQSRVRKSIRQLEEHLRLLEKQRSRFR